MRRVLRNLAIDRRGNSLIEFAILLPVFAYMLYGMLGYGQYFLLAHSVQQLANDAARSTVAGMTASERLSLATATVSAELPALNELNAAHVTTGVTETSDTVTVSVRYDASNVALFKTRIVPMPDALIERRAVVRPGGVA